MLIKVKKRSRKSAGRKEFSKNEVVLDQVKNDLSISADNKDKKEGTFINIKMKKDLRLYKT